MSQQVPPMGATCALKRAAVGPGGTATACPAPIDWTMNEMARSQTQTPGGWIDNALFHDRDHATGLDCWTRALNARIVSE